MNLRSIDLNLLTLFDALLEERQLSRAASKLGMSQSAASNALSRLRLTFKDDLFIGTREGMVPTPKAQTLAIHVRSGLSSIRVALSEDSEFAPSISPRTFRVLLNDFVEPVLLPKLLTAIQAKGNLLAIESFSSQRNEYIEQVKKAQIDLYFDQRIDQDAQLERLKVYEETLSVIVHQDHPRIDKSLSIDDYLREKHIIYTNHDGQKTSLELALEAHKTPARKILIQASHLSLVPNLVSQSDALATMPTQVAKRFCLSHPLKSYNFPFEIDPLPLYMMWHKALNHDKAHQWLRSVIAGSD